MHGVHTWYYHGPREYMAPLLRTCALAYNAQHQLESRQLNHSSNTTACMQHRSRACQCLLQRLRQRSQLLKD
jgi:hypothetical protein